MITCNGIVGLSLLVATLKGRIAVFNAAGSGAALATIAALATLSLVLPTFTTSSPGPTFSGFQLAFAALASIGLYALFVFVQTVRHRDYFLPPESLEGDAGDDSGAAAGADADAHAERPSLRVAWTSAALLGLSLVGVIGLAKGVSPSIERAVRDAGLPVAVVGVVIALLVLLPESMAAVRAARRGNVQTSLNLAYGSAMASIGLTIPAIAVASRWMAGPLELGLSPVEMVLLALTVLVGVLTVTPGRATLLQGGVHLAIFSGFLVLAISP
jgi:Ca2+:H+ antiporter